MSPISLLFIVAVSLSAALASCGSGSGGFPGPDGGAPDQEPPADELSAARSRATEMMEAAMEAPSLTTIKAARAAMDSYVKVAEAALRGAVGSNRQAAAQSALRTAQSVRNANQRRLDGLQEALGASAGSGSDASPGGPASPGESANPGASSGSLAQRLANLRARSLTSLERGHNYRTISGQAAILYGTIRCSESAGTCGIGGLQQGGNDYLNPAFFYTSLATPFTAAPVNGVDTFSVHHDYESVNFQDWKLLALGQFSAARMRISINGYIRGISFGDIWSYGVALGERHSGRPSGASESATWRGQMVGAAIDNGSVLAGESALTYSFSSNTVDVQISNIRAVGDVAPYSGGTSFTWSGLDVNSDGSFYISGYNNDRSGLTLSSALHPTLGYIDGDFYGPNAEEAAGIFTRNNVNGAWLAKSSGWRTSADDRETPTGGEQPSPGSEEPAAGGGQPSSGGGQGAQGGSTGSLSLAQRLANLRARSLTSFEYGLNYRTRGGSTGISGNTRCSESTGTCGIGGLQQGGNRALNNPAFFYTPRATPFTAAPVNGVDTFVDHEDFLDPNDDHVSLSWKLLMLGQFSAAKVTSHRDFIDSNFVRGYTGQRQLSLETAESYGLALGERHSGRPSGTSGSATWRGQMVGAAIDNGSVLAGESALTYSFSANTVDVQISNIRAIGNVAPYAGNTSFTWSGLNVNSDGSFYISGYNNDRSELTFSSALHPTLGYIDGDFYGPNAEEVAGIFTRGNVNGAWLAKK